VSGNPRRWVEPAQCRSDRQLLRPSPWRPAARRLSGTSAVTVLPRPVDVTFLVAIGVRTHYQRVPAKDPRRLPAPQVVFVHELGYDSPGQLRVIRARCPHLSPMESAQ
jgi:hypothetical protein